MKLPDKIFISKNQLLKALEDDVQKSIENPGVILDHLEWTLDGVIAHLIFKDEVDGSKI